MLAWIVDKIYPVRETKKRPHEPRGPLFPFSPAFYHAAICGRTQQGKTWLLLQLLSCVPDFIAIYPGGKDEPRYRAICRDVLIEPDLSVIHQTIAERAASGERIAICIVPREYEDIEAIATIVFELGNIVFAVDEAHEYWKSSKVPESVMRVARRGAAEGVKMVITSQRPKDVHLDVISQCDTFFIFHMFLEADLKRVEEACCIPCGIYLHNLRPREYICIREGNLLGHR